MKNLIIGLILSVISLLLAACGAPPGNGGSTLNSNAPANTVVRGEPVKGPIDTHEPDKYKATVALHVETVGEGARITSPSLSANVARSGDDRRMEFTIPAGGHVVYLDKGDKHYL